MCTNVAIAIVWQSAINKKIAISGKADYVLYYTITIPITIGLACRSVNKKIIFTRKIFAIFRPFAEKPPMDGFARNVARGCRSVEGFRICVGSNFAILPLLSRSPLMCYRTPVISMYQCTFVDSLNNFDIIDKQGRSLNLILITIMQSSKSAKLMTTAAHFEWRL